MKKFKTAVIGNYWKFKKVPWQIHVPDGFKNYHAPVTDVTIEIETGPSTDRMTATRIIAGGVLAGPLGAIIGGMAKKDTTFNNMVIHFEDGVVRIPFNNKEYRDAQAFLEEVIKLQNA